MVVVVAGVVISDAIPLTTARILICGEEKVPPDTFRGGAGRFGSTISIVDMR